MDVRSASPEDAARIEEIARETFTASYSLGPDEIEAIVNEVFSTEALEGRMANEGRSVFVVEDEGRVIGFADLEMGDIGVLHWLHVDPEARREGAGTLLFERVETAVFDADKPLEAHVLSQTSEGEGFCEQFGFSQSGGTELEFDGESFFQEVHTKRDGHSEAGEPSVDVPETISVDETELYLDREEDVPGTEGPFFPLFRGEDSTERYGFFCSNCGSSDTASDTLGRLECQRCGNKHLADEWDAAYL